MKVTATEARKRWADVLDAVNRNESVVVTRRGKPYAMIVRWIDPPIAEPFLLASRLPYGWRFVGAPERATVVLLHSSGLWTEMDGFALATLSEEEVRAICDGLQSAVSAGMTGKVMMVSTTSGGRVNVEVRPDVSPHTSA